MNPTPNIPLTYITCSPETLLDSAFVALDLVAECGEAGVTRLLLPFECLPPAFFDLKTGLAGEVLLKFSNYRLKVAAVVPAEAIPGGRFAEFAAETNSGRDFRIYPTPEAAAAWLTA